MKNLSRITLNVFLMFICILTMVAQPILLQSNVWESKGLANLERQKKYNFLISTVRHLPPNCYDVWNITEHTVSVKHHNWDKIFGKVKPTLSDITPYVEAVLKDCDWELSGKILRGKKGKIIGEGIIMKGEVKGYTIWVEGTKMSDGTIIVKNAGVD